MFHVPEADIGDKTAGYNKTIQRRNKIADLFYRWREYRGKREYDRYKTEYADKGYDLWPFHLVASNSFYRV